MGSPRDGWHPGLGACSRRSGSRPRREVSWTDRSSAGRAVGQIGLLFLDFTREVIGLHVNGRARAMTQEVLRELGPLPVDEHPGRKPLLWVHVVVEKAYVHCSKHIPLLAPLPEQRHWGTDDHTREGGDFLHVTAERAAAQR